MNKFLLFFISYMIGLLSFYISENKYILLVFIIFLYLIIVLNTEKYTRLVIEPLIIGLFSVTIVYYLEGMNVNSIFMYFLLMIFLVGFSILKDREKKETKENIDSNYYIKRMLLPMVFPVSIYVLLILMINSEYLALIFFWLGYLLMLLYFSDYIQTKFYFAYFTISQVITLKYLGNFMEDLNVLEEYFIIALVIALSFLKYAKSKRKNKKIGGNQNTSFFRTLSRRKI